MKKKVNKVTVGTRLTIEQKDELEEEALANDFSFCAYLEHLLINRDSPADYSQVSTLKEDLQLIQAERDSLVEQVESLKETISYLEDDVEDEDDELIDTEHQDLLDKIQELKNQVHELEEENTLLQTLEDEADASLNNDSEEVDSDEVIQALLNEIETEKATLESENQTLKHQVSLLQQEVTVQKAAELELDSNALGFLLEKHPNLSKEEIIKIALDCSATNEEKGWYQTVYSFTDYVEREKSFINYQNN